MQVQVKLLTLHGGLDNEIRVSIFIKKWSAPFNFWGKGYSHVFLCPIPILRVSLSIAPNPHQVLQFLVKLPVAEFCMDLVHPLALA
jgi:hypothetical protein